MRLIEELNLRTNKLTPLFESLQEISSRMDALQEHIALGARVSTTLLLVAVLGMVTWRYAG